MTTTAWAYITVWDSAMNTTQSHYLPVETPSIVAGVHAAVCRELGEDPTQWGVHSSVSPAKNIFVIVMYSCRGQGFFVYNVKF
jgi:hypothetical protein